MSGVLDREPSPQVTHLASPDPFGEPFLLRCQDLGLCILNVHRGSEQVSEPGLGQTRGKGGVRPAPLPSPRGPHIWAPHPHASSEPSLGRSLCEAQGGGSSRRRQVRKRWGGGEGVVRAAFFRQPPNGLHFQIVKLEMGPHPINFIFGAGGKNITSLFHCDVHNEGLW